MYVIGNTRAFLVLLIAVDRVFATYSPVSFYIHRQKIPLLVILAVVFSYSAFDIYVTFGICQETINVPPGCVTILCGMSLCYYNYWLNYEKVAYSLTIFMSIVLTLKLFVWNKFKKQVVSRNLKRVNFLAVIDTVIIIFFDLIPPVIVTTVPNFYFWLGPVNTVFKTLGFVVEGFWVFSNLKKKYRRSTPVVNISGRSGHY